MTSPSAAARVVDSLHLLALALWIATLCAVGVAATAVFITMPRIGLELPEYAGYVQASRGDAGRDFGRLAGGMVIQPVFRIASFVEVVLAAIVAITLAAQLARRIERGDDGDDRTIRSCRSCRSCRSWRHAPNWLRAALVVACLSLACIQTFERGPRMDRTLDESLAAAREGRFEAAEQARSAFNTMHLPADRSTRARLVLLLAALALVPFAVEGRPRRRPPKDDAVAMGRGAP